MSTSSSALKISISFNVFLVLALLAMVGLLIRQGWLKATIQGARPCGTVVTLLEDTRIVSAEAPAIVLPKGTVLQESTPQGAATLGKISDRQYLLTIKTEDGEFSKNRPYEKAESWVAPYVFAATGLRASRRGDSQQEP